MNFILTSDPISTRYESKTPSLKDVEDFAICLTHAIPVSVLNNRSLYYIFDFIYREGIEEYEESYNAYGLTFKVVMHPAKTIQAGLGHAIDIIYNTEDIDDDNLLGIAPTFEWSRPIGRYLKKMIAKQSASPRTSPTMTRPRRRDISVDVTDMYQYLKVPSTAKLADMLKHQLGVEHILPGEPMTLGYAMTYILEEGRL